MDHFKKLRSKRNTKKKANSTTVDDNYVLEPPPSPAEDPNTPRHDHIQTFQNAPAGVNDIIKEEIMGHLQSQSGINEFRRLTWLGAQLLNAVVAELMFRQPDFADHEVLIEESKKAREELKYDEYCQKLGLVFPKNHYHLPKWLNSDEALFRAYIALWQIRHSLDNPSLVQFFMRLNRIIEGDLSPSLSASPAPSFERKSCDTPKAIEGPATSEYKNQPLSWYAGQLNQLGQKNNCVFEYRPVDTVPEPGHISAFKYEVLLGSEVVGSATEVSKKRAKQTAAKEAYLRFRATGDQE